MFNDENIISLMEKQLQNKIQNMTCPTHNIKATVKIEGPNLDNVNLAIFACCEKFKNIVYKKLNSAT